MQNIKSSLKALIAALAVIFFSINQSYAAGGIYSQGPRGVSYNNNGPRCNTSDLSFDPFNSRDVLWEADNPICIAFLTSTALVLSGLRYYTAYACLEPQMAAEQALANASGMPLSPTMIATNARASAKCSALIAEQNYTQAWLCCGGIATVIAQTTAAVSALAILYGVAEGAHKYARICGADWNVWTKDSDWTGKNDRWTLGKGNDSNPSYQYGLEQDNRNGAFTNVHDSNGTLVPAIKIKRYREYIYGGEEYEDNGSDACPNPNWSDANSNQTLGYPQSDGGGKQKYYFRGPKLAPNFACERFLLSRGGEDKKAGLTAFSCCNKRSQETICIENNDLISGGTTGANYESKFCNIGERCNIKGVWFDVYDSKIEPNYICSKTYSTCPYNHLLGGGTEIENVDEEGTSTNYCQYMKHCVKKPDKVFIRTSDLNGAYISSACRDLKGNSQNSYTYNFGILPINSRQFSAPMAQCFKETLENLFLNKAGSTKCLSPDESPDQNNRCTSGYVYQQGMDAPGASFFSVIQDRFRDIIKMIMTVAITILGLNVLLAGKQIERKELLMFVVKLAVITYFALGNAWQSAFFNGVFNTGMVIADIVMKPDEGTLVADDMNLQETSLVRPLTSAEQQQQAAIESKLDGCQFPKFNYNDSSDNRIKNFAYPYGKEYLKIWDMFDCKIAAALGFGPGVSVPNIAWMILGGFFTGGAGIVFFVGSFIFAFYLIALVIRALHIFLLSAISIILLVYVSPLTITSALFKKTNSIYQKWQAQMVGLILQPVILFAYLGILLTVFNKTMIGDVTFKGDGRNTPKQIVCQGEVQNTSMYCIFQIGEIKSYNGFEPLGLGIPMLTNMNATKINSIIKAAFLMFIFTKILDQIPSIATALVGGAKLASNSVGAGAMARKSFEALHAVQKRALRGIKKHAPAAAKRAAGAAKSVGQSIGDRGTAVEKSDPNKGAPKAAPDDVIRDEDGKGGKP